jgi:AcrR family transcriptional regulator
MPASSKTDKEKIISAALVKFRIDGFHKTTVDEIGLLSGVSKNTIYKYFSSKENIAEAVVESTIFYVQDNTSKILKQKKDAVSKFLELLTFVVNSVLKYHESLLIELKRHLPEQWAKIEKVRNEKMYANLSKLIKQGKSEKLFLNYPDEIILSIFLNSIKSVINPHFVLNNKFSLNDAVRMTYEILLNGILTLKGKKILKKLKNNNYYV